MTVYIQLVSTENYAVHCFDCGGTCTESAPLMMFSPIYPTERPGPLAIHVHCFNARVAQLKEKQIGGFARIELERR